MTPPVTAPETPPVEPPEARDGGGRRARLPGRYAREGDGLEFDRVSFFTDAVYAIAMTLLVVELGVPRVADAPGALAAALAEDWTAIVGFFIGFIVLGRYWLAHHQFFSILSSLDSRLIGLNLVYLAFVAFSPFPVGLLSDYEGSSLTFLIFAATMAAISGLEVVMFVYATRHGHTRVALPPEVVRFALLASGLPVLVMIASMPLGLIAPSLALASWLLMFPLGAWLNRHAPTAARDLLPE